ncbi:TetR family transcriptional regulator [Paenibacillus radicis (ex Gao et al. 2016)]|uniref:TetR family transcriptional regulator n=1 Tax=Paenibacillus radicis (ex Gao et al. 2016) TaxID=1737354 RepID=A0A917HAR1_9BACL|nr:TetR family transcriptional regulator [Paenibacillus radicis (ex Gao et al. 2016)]GGG72854.1 TetR family transcriptional regulator [Paenibacillus radicis (ex Gao et al. 2016)]
MANDQVLTKEAILDAAEQVLRRYGPDKTSVVDIAKALQVSHGTLYRHFPSKTALREAVTERWLQQSVAEPLSAIIEKQHSDADEALHMWLKTLIEIKRSASLNDPEMFAMYAAVTLDATAIIAEHIDSLTGQIEVLLERGKVSGAFRYDQPADRLARAVFSATAKFHHPAHAAEWTGESADEEFGSLWKLLLSGLASSK